MQPGDSMQSTLDVPSAAVTPNMADQVNSIFESWMEHTGGRFTNSQWEDEKRDFEAYFCITCKCTANRSLQPNQGSLTGRDLHNTVVFKTPLSQDNPGRNYMGNIYDHVSLMRYWQSPLIIFIARESDGTRGEVAGIIVDENHPSYNDWMRPERLRQLFPSDYEEHRIFRNPVAVGSPSWLLKNFKNLILEGVPGTGKTHAFQEIVDGWRSATAGQPPKQHQMTFHPTTAYEEFMIGIRPVQPDGNGPPFDVVDGFFKKIVDEAKADHTVDHIVLLDEFNRANIPKVMGDLLTLLEPSKRARYEGGNWSGFEVTLPYQRSDATEENKFVIPENIYIVATLNTTDRSVAPMDSALRRRFVFSRIEPMTADALTNSLQQQRSESTETTLPEVLTQSIQLWSNLNVWFQRNIGPDGMLGHSYLFELSKICSPSEGNTGVIIECWNALILPQINDILINNDMIHHLSSFNEAIKQHTVSGMKLVAQAIGSGINRMPFLKFETVPEENLAETIDDSESE